MIGRKTVMASDTTTTRIPTTGPDAEAMMIRGLESFYEDVAKNSGETVLCKDDDNNSAAMANAAKQPANVDRTRRREKRALVVLRGIAHAPSYVHYSGKRINVDFRNAVDSIQNNVIRDLRENAGYGAVDVHVVTYPDVGDDVKAALQEAYSPCAIHYMDVPYAKGSQRAVFKQCLRVISGAASPDTEIAVIARLDVRMKTPLSRLRLDPGRVNFLWPEKHAQHQNQPHLPVGDDEKNELQLQQSTKPEDVKVTCDVLHVLPPDAAPVFLEAVDASRPSNNLHGVYVPLLRRLSAARHTDSRFGAQHSAPEQQRRHVLKKEEGDFISFAFDEPHESNTDLVPNPVYHILRDGATKMLGGPTPVFWKKMLGKHWKAL